MLKFNHSLAASAALLALVTLSAPTFAQGQKGDATQKVDVVNTPDRPVPVRDVENPARQPFQGDLPLTVPDGKRLVIEFFSARYDVGGNGSCRIATVLLHNGPAGGGMLHNFTPTLTAATATLVYFSVSQQTRIYAEPGATIDGFPYWVGNCVNPSQAESVSGYLVDVAQEAQQ